MYVLGIETSCDETSVAVVKDGKKILSNEVSSSEHFHSKYGGIVPEIASRLQLETIAQVADVAIKNAKIDFKDIGLISVTSGPGLPGSLLVGISFAKALGLSLGVPIVAVNHVHSHFYANFLTGQKVRLPFIGLVVSGGHTSLFFVRRFNKIEQLGETQDDACGEAFDKVARILRLGYPGGPQIERLAEQGDCKRIKFACSGTRHPLDFSFSGIKTAVLYYVQRNVYSRKPQVVSRRSQAADIAAGFQEAAINALIEKSFFACRQKKVNRIVIGGGVVANGRLRERFSESAEEKGIKCFFPAKPLCIDNAAMVAGFGYQLFKNGYRSGLNFNLALN